MFKENTFGGPSPDGSKMLRLIETQLAFGPRHLGAGGHEKVQAYLRQQSKKTADATKLQTWTHRSADGREYKIQNLIGRFKPEAGRRIIIGTHYDTKRDAHFDKDFPDRPVPGANDGASGTAVLLELARILNENEQKPDVGVDLVFFDGEEGEPDLRGDYSTWRPLGSTYFAENLGTLYGGAKPELAIIADMVCDKDFQLQKEPASVRSAGRQVDELWRAGREIDTDVFQDVAGPAVRDDHTPLIAAGIPAMLLIDFGYPHFHTTEDTLDKCSAESLQTVAAAVLRYVYDL